MQVLFLTEPSPQGYELTYEPHAKLANVYYAHSRLLAYIDLRES